MRTKLENSTCCNTKNEIIVTAQILTSCFSTTGPRKPEAVHNAVNGVIFTLHTDTPLALDE